MAVFGFGLDSSPDLFAHAEWADRAGLDHVSVADHPYLADRPDAYALLGVLLGRTSSVAGLVNVTNPARPAPMLARTVSTLSALSGGRIVLGMGAGGTWDEIVRLGVPRRTPAEAVRAMAETITVVRLLSGGGPPVTFDGEFFQVTELRPAPAPAPPVWTGSVGPRSLAVTGRLADGWIPGRAADWNSERYRTSRPVIDEAAVAAGRSPDDVATIFNLRTRFDRPLGQWVDELADAVLTHGAGGFTYFPIADSQTIDHALGRWAEEVVPAVREAIQR